MYYIYSGQASLSILFSGKYLFFSFSTLWSIETFHLKNIKKACDVLNKDLLFDDKMEIFFFALPYLFDQIWGYGNWSFYLHRKIFGLIDFLVSDWEWMQKNLDCLGNWFITYTAAKE